MGIPEPIDRILELFQRPDVVPPGDSHYRLCEWLYNSQVPEHDGGVRDRILTRANEILVCDYYNSVITVLMLVGWTPVERLATLLAWGRPEYPRDMLVFRHEGNKVRVDILGPHDDARADAAEKAVGLADFSRKHGAAFGRIEMIRVAKGRIQRLRLHQESIRDKVLKVTDLKHLAKLYRQHG